METDMIKEILSTNPQTRQIYQGCFPADQVPSPSNLKYPAAMVVNLEPIGFDGSHWIALFAEGMKRPIYYFDSLSMPISPIIEMNFLYKFPKTIKNDRPFQSPSRNVSTCAHHCILFVYYMALGFTFPQYLQFLSQKENADSYVKFIVNKMRE